MAQVIELDSGGRRWARYTQPRLAETGDDIWPEVSTGYSTDSPAPANPKNAQGRVLLEVLLILAIAGMGAVVATLIGPMPP